MLAIYDGSGLPLPSVCRYTSDACSNGSAYSDTSFHISNLSLVDLFCYFSHHLVTIPPGATFQEMTNSPPTKLTQKLFHLIQYVGSTAVIDMEQRYSVHY